MFGNDPSEKRKSLLMRAQGDAALGYPSAEPGNVVEMPRNDSARLHQRAKASRKSAKPNKFLDALSRKDDSSFHEDEAVKAIERDVEALMRSAPESQSADRAHARPDDTAYSAPSAYHDPDPFRPLIDPSIMLQSLWQWRYPIIGLTLLGGVAGAFYALSMPKMYTAYSTVAIDPREIKLVERDLTPEFLGNESALAIVDSQLQTVISTPVLQKVVDDLKLANNADFNGTADSGIGLLDGIAFVQSLFSDETPVDRRDRVVIENLRNAVSAQRTARTFVFEVSATAKSPRLAADIANSLTQSFVEFQTERQSEAARNASDALGGQIGALKAAVEQAEQKAAQWAIDNDLTRVDGQTVSDTQLATTAQQLSAAKAATIAARSLAEAAQGASVDDVINGGLPANLVTPALTTFRAQFASLSQNAASLEQALGPRHPRLANAIAAREAARDEIAAELRRIIAGTQADLRSAIRNEQEIAAALAQAKVESGNSTDALVKLRELEAEIEAAQTLYKAALLRAGETNQLEELSTVNASIVAEAEPPLTQSSVSRKLVTLTGAGLGFFVGVGLAFLWGLRACIQANNSPNRKTPERNPTSPKPTGGRGISRRDLPSAFSRREKTPSPQQQQATASNENSMYPGAPFYLYPPMQQPQQAYPTYPQGYGMPMQPMMQPVYPAPMMYPQMPMAPQFAPQPYPQQAVYGFPTGPVAPQAQQQTQPQPQAGPSQEELELEELRASVRDIRDVVDHLAQSRSNSRRFG